MADAVHSHKKQVIVILRDVTSKLAIVVVDVGLPVYLRSIAQVRYPLVCQDIRLGAISVAREVEKPVPVGLENRIDPDGTLALALVGVTDVLVALVVVRDPVWNVKSLPDVFPTEVVLLHITDYGVY